MSGACGNAPPCPAPFGVKIEILRCLGRFGWWVFVFGGGGIGLSLLGLIEDGSQLLA